MTKHAQLTQKGKKNFTSGFDDLYMGSYRGFFVHIFCLISISIPVSCKTTDILVLNIERIRHVLKPKTKPPKRNESK